MRSLLYSLLSLAAVASTLAAEPAAAVTPAAAVDDWEDKVPDTVFNGQTVPPMIELGERNFDKEISHGNWYVPVVWLCLCLC
jgi:protein disulfide-isomerase